jgi:hypothetical protein
VKAGTGIVINVLEAIAELEFKDLMIVSSATNNISLYTATSEVALIITNVCLVSGTTAGLYAIKANTISMTNTIIMHGELGVNVRDSASFRLEGVACVFCAAGGTFIAQPKSVYRDVTISSHGLPVYFSGSNVVVRQIAIEKLSGSSYAFSCDQGTNVKIFTSATNTLVLDKTKGFYVYNSSRFMIQGSAGITVLNHSGTQFVKGLTGSYVRLSSGVNEPTLQAVLSLGSVGSVSSAIVTLDPPLDTVGNKNSIWGA